MVGLEDYDVVLDNRFHIIAFDSGHVNDDLYSGLVIEELPEGENLDNLDFPEFIQGKVEFSKDFTEDEERFLRSVGILETAERLKQEYASSENGDLDVELEGLRLLIKNYINTPKNDLNDG